MYSFTEMYLTQLVQTNQIRYTDYWIISESRFWCYVYNILKTPAGNNNAILFPLYKNISTHTAHIVVSLPNP